MLVTLKPIAVYRRKDGTFPVNIRVYFKGQARRLPTSIVCYPEDRTRTGKIKGADVLRRCEDLIRQMRAAIADVSPFELEGRDVDWVVDRIRDAVATPAFRLDFFEWGRKVAAGKVAETTRHSYYAAIAALEKFLGRQQLDINEITRHMLLDFADAVDAAPKLHRLKDGSLKECGSRKRPGGQRNMHLIKLAHIFNAAKERYNDEDSGRIVIPRSPFSHLPKVKAPPSEGAESLGLEVMQRIISARPSEPDIRDALDIFVISFALMGVNLADLYAAKDFEGDVWKYNRQKTRRRRADKAEARVYVPEVIMGRIERFRGTAGVWWLPRLRSLSHTKDLVTQKVNYGLSKWARQEGVPRFTMGSARHTWATLARQAGIEKATVDEGLVHVGDFAVTDIYAERDWKRINDANALLLGKFRWE